MAEGRPKYSRILQYSGVIMFVLLTLGCMVAYTAFVNDGLSKLNVNKFPILRDLTQWEITLGELPVRGEEIQASNAEWQPYLEVQQSAAGRSHLGEYWVRVRIPKEIEQFRDAELFVINVASYEVFVDNRKLASVYADQQEPKRVPVYRWHMFPIPKDAAGKLLLLRIMPDKAGINKGTQNIVEAKELLIQLLRYDTLKWILMVCFLFMSVVSFGAFMFSNRDPVYFYFSILALSAGMPCMASMYTLQLFGDWTRLTYYWWIFMPLGTFALVGIFERLAGPEPIRRLRSIRYVLGIFTVIFALTDLYSTELYETFLYVYLVILLLVVPLLGLPMLRRYRSNKDVEAAWLIMGIISILFGFAVPYVFLFFPGLVSLAQRFVPLLYYYWKESSIIVGVFLFVSSLGMVLVVRLRAVFMQNQAMSGNLLESNRRLKELDRLKDDFLANTSHELRTPLQGIIGLTESLLDGAAGPLQSKVKYNLELVVSSGRRLSRLINDLLDLSKLKHQDIRLDLAPQSMRDSVALVLAAFEPLAAAKGIRLLNEVRTGLPMVMADANRLQQILYNLIGNAVKFTDMGEIRITGQVKDAMAEISIHDTGVGIPEARLPDIGKPFEQAHSGGNRGGTGLGLTISQKLIELHGGELHIESAEGRGTTASFTLAVADESPVGSSSPAPFIDPATFSGIAAARSAVSPEVSARDDTAALTELMFRDGQAPAWSADIPPATVLVVDDEPINLQVIENFLAGYPLELLKAATGQEALAIMERQQPDLVLLDILLPDINGYDVCGRIRQRRDESALPVIMLTAKGRLSDLLDGFDAGANDYIVKPFAKNELLARVGIQLKLSRFTHALEEMVQERTAELEQTARRLKESIRESAETLNELSILEERNRISQEIHDHVGHTLTASIVQLEAAKMLLERGDARGVDKVKLSQQLVRKGLDDIRESVRLMKQQGVEFKLEPAMIHLLEQTADAAGLRAEYFFSPLPQLTSMQKKALYHALKEGLTNGIRHGRCTCFRFRLEYANSKLMFSLWNDGIRYTPSAPGFGLQTMNERIVQLGGKMELKNSDENGGCLLWIELPVI